MSSAHVEDESSGLPFFLNVTLCSNLMQDCIVDAISDEFQAMNPAFN